MKLFPKVKAPEKELYLIDTRNLSEEEKYLSAVLQGLVNRASPRIFRHVYVQRDFHYGPVQDVENTCWYELLKKKGYCFKEKDIYGLMEIFSDCFNGAVLYDELEMYDIRHTSQYEINLTTMLCAQKNALPVTARFNKDLNLPVIFDTRGRWQDRFAAHDWASENLWNESNKKVLCTLPAHYTNMVDYLTAFKVFTFYYPNWPSERDDEYLKRFLMLTPPNTPVIGVWDLAYTKEPVDPNYDQERNFIDCISKAGKFFVVTHEASNLTVHSGMPPFKAIRNEKIKLKPEYDENCLSFVYSEGDNISFQMCNYPMLWNDKGRTKVPITWSISSAMTELCPDILQHYFDGASGYDDYIISTSGAGYTFPSIYGDWYGERKDEIFAEFLNITRYYMENLEVCNVAVIDHPDKEYIADKSILEEYVKALPGLKGLFCDYPTSHGRLSDKPNYLLNGVSVFHAQNRSYRCKELVEEIIALKKNHQNPLSLYVFVSGWGLLPSDLLQIAMGLEGHFQVVPASQLSQLLLSYEQAIIK